MVNLFLFRSKRVDGRMELYPLPHQRTISSESGHSREFVDVDTERRAQAANACRSMYCGRNSGSLFIVKCEGNTPFGSRLPVYSRGEEKVYRVDSLVALDDITSNDTLYFEFVRRYCLSIETVEELRSLGLATWTATFGGIAGAPVREADASVDNESASVAGMTSGNESYGINRNLLAGINKMKAIASFLALRGHNVPTINRKMLLLSQLNDGMRNGIVQFQFRKQNGDIRTAYGTLVSRVITSLSPSSGAAAQPEGDRQEDGEHFFYFDVQQKGWRCFCTDDFRTFDRAESFYVGDTIGEAERMRIAAIASAPVVTE